MKIAIVAGIICALCLISVAKAAPAEGDILEQEAFSAFNGELTAQNPQNLVTLTRQKRFTCDVLKSPPACSAHCVALGRRRGGYCRRGTCVCRQ